MVRPVSPAIAQPLTSASAKVTSEHYRLRPRLKSRFGPASTPAFAHSRWSRMQPIRPRPATSRGPFGSGTRAFGRGRRSTSREPVSEVHGTVRSPCMTAERDSPVRAGFQRIPADMFTFTTTERADLHAAVMHAFGEAEQRLRNDRRLHEV